MTKTNRNHRNGARSCHQWAFPALLSGPELADYAFRSGFLFSLLARDGALGARSPACRKVSPGMAGLPSMGPAAERGEYWDTPRVPAASQTPRLQATARRKALWANGSLGRLLGPAWTEGDFIPVLNRTQGEAK